MSVKASIVAVLQLILVITAQNNIFNDDLKMLGDLLKGEFNVTANIENLRQFVAGNPSKIEIIRKTVQNLNTGIPKLRAVDSMELVKGILEINTAITKSIKADVSVPALTSLVSSTIGLVKAETVSKIIHKGVHDLSQVVSDEILENKATLSASRLAMGYSYLLTKHKHELDYHDVMRIMKNVRINSGHSILEYLAKQITTTATSSTSNDASLCLKYSIFFAKIAAVRDLVMNDVIIQFKRAGDAAAAKSYANANDESIATYRRIFGFLQSPSLANVEVVSLYHPPSHSKETALLNYFLEQMATSKNLYPNGKYVLFSVKWPSYHVYLDNDGYVKLTNGDVFSTSQITFHTRKDGYMELQQNGKWLKIDDKYPDYIASQPTPPGDDPNGHFVVVKYPNTDIITVVSRNFPGKFWKGVKHTYYIRFRKGYTGTDSQFRIKLCKKFSPDTNRCVV